MEADKFLGNAGEQAEEQDIFDLVPDGPAKFEAAEHDALAAACTLKWPNGVTSSGGDEDFPLIAVPLTGSGHKDKTYEITFNKIVPLAGDFFTTYDYLPISFGEPRKTPDAEEKDTTLKGPKTTQKGRFQQALAMLSQDALGTLGPTIDYLAYDRDLAHEINEGGHTHASQVYGSVDTLNGKAFTGNGAWAWAMLGGGPFHYLTGLAMNMDHFGVWAQDVYTTGHSIALDLAEQGREKKPDGTTRSSCERLSALQEAYLAESFAAHFLTDLFSAGHLRACRREFHQTPSFKAISGGAVSFVTSSLNLGIIDDVAYDLIGGQTKDTWDMQVNKSHENDGTAGLLVRNAKGERWVAYGDKQFFSPANRASRLRSILACQAGVDEIYDVWNSKKEKPNIVYARENRPQDMYEALRQAPVPTEYKPQEDGPWNGTTARLWQSSVPSQETVWDDAKALDGVSKNVFQRRVDVNDMDNFELKKNSNPGWKYNYSSIGSDDVLEIVNKSFIGKKEAFPAVPFCEMLSGGFLQIQEYKDRIYGDTKFDHALNFWGPAKYAIPGEKDQAKPSFMLRRRWDSLTYPEGMGRIQGDQTNLHWMSHVRGGTTTDVLRVFHRESDKTVNISLYSFLAVGDQNDPAALSEVMPGGKPLFPTNNLEIEYSQTFWKNEKLSLRDCGSMRFYNFYKTVPGMEKGSNDKYNQVVGFRTYTESATNAKGSKTDRMTYSLCLQLHQSGGTQPSKTGFKCKVAPKSVWDTTEGLTTPDFIKPYQNANGTDHGLLVIRRIGSSGSGQKDKEMVVEVRAYWLASIAEHGLDQAQDLSLLQDCWTIHQVKIKAPANFTPPLSDPAAWQVLVDDVRNCGRPELVFLVGGGISEYNIQIFGFNDDGALTERKIASVPAVPKELPTYSWWNVDFSKHHFAALCPSETTPWTHDIIQVSQLFHYGKTNALKVGTPDKYLYFRTWIKGDQAPPTGGIPPEWKERPERVEFHWQSGENTQQPCETTITKIPKRESIPPTSPAVGWTRVIDGLLKASDGTTDLKDEIGMTPGYFSIKWARCAVRVPADAKARGPNDPKVTTTRGVQEIFSYYGVLGMRVFAPLAKNDYSVWQLVVQIPFMGQTSRGTGKTTGGNWNSSSILPWGTANTFGDLNEWCRTAKNWRHFNEADHDGWDKLEHGYGTKGRPYQMGK